MSDEPEAVLGHRIARAYRDVVLPGLVVDQAAVEVDAWAAPGEPVSFAEAVRQEYAPIEPGTAWGPPWGTAWLRLHGEVPASWSAELPVAMEVDLGFSPALPGFQAEGLFWSVDGRVLAGIEPRNTALTLPDAAPGSLIDLLVEAASNPDLGSDWSFRPSPMGDPATAGDRPLYRFGGARLVLRDPELVALERDWATLQDLLAVLPIASGRRARIQAALLAAADVLDPVDRRAAAPVARAVLAPALAAHAGAVTHEVSAVGHAHIDSAWLWPVRETIRKCARTFSNVLELMDRYPDFVFTASSAQQYQWIRDHYPDLFARIAARVAEGRWIPVGGMWIESDTNLPSGESLVRQFTAGAGFFAREFGTHSEVAWLPDSFGYSASLPQLMRGAGATSFLTQKLSWNDTNRMPHHTFDWEGIDGTRILTHFPPVARYNSDLGAADLARAELEHSERARSDRSIVPFGYGDGGGGPTAEMIETGRRKADLDGSPRVRFEGPAAFFDRVREELPDPAVWSGELYLEFHRGTYTSQARTKHGNRRNEGLLHEAELWSATAAVRAGLAYPAEDLRHAWESIMLAQFHDVLPGTSIAWVHREAERMHVDVGRRLEGLIRVALDALGAAPDVGAEGEAVVANPAPVELDGVPAFGIGPRRSAAPRTARRTPDGGAVLESQALRVELDARAGLVSLTDRATRREYIANGDRGNVLQLFRDTPGQWDAWDLDLSYRRMPIEDDEPVELRLEGDEVRVQRALAGSRIEQRIALSRDGAALDIETRIDWNERQRLLKLAFEFDVHADRSTSEIQFGHIHRPTHANTSWDAARFEISGHRWVRVADATAAITVANDRVYGRDVTRRTRTDGGTTTTIRESLLRAPVFPDPDADLGQHVFRHAIRPGSLDRGIAEGYRLNRGQRVLRAAAVDPLVRLVGAGALIETIKLADDGSGDVVVRLYECLGGRASVRVVPGFATDRAWRVDLLERPSEPAAASDPAAADLVALELQLRAFEIATLRLRRV